VIGAYMDCRTDGRSRRWSAFHQVHHTAMAAQVAAPAARW